MGFMFTLFKSWYYNWEKVRLGGVVRGRNIRILINSFSSSPEIYYSTGCILMPNSHRFCG